MLKHCRQKNLKLVNGYNDGHFSGLTMSPSETKLANVLGDRIKLERLMFCLGVNLIRVVTNTRIYFREKLRFLQFKKLLFNDRNVLLLCRKT